jgi:hypothetical protein
MLLQISVRGQNQRRTQKNISISYVLLTVHLDIIVQRKRNLIHNVFLVYFVNLYMFRAYLDPSTGGIARSEPGDTRCRTGGEVKGKLVNGVGSQYSHATSECGVSSITQVDAHTSAASRRLNWRPPPIQMDSSVSGKDEIWFLRVCHHVPHEVYNSMYTTISTYYSF